MDEKIKNLHLPAHLEEELRRAAAKPSWESRNEGVHERVNFDDTIWGFHLAGGAYYNTPLRVTHVRDGSRAEHAGIKPGDVLQRINGLDSSTITLEKAHDMILDSGIHIKLEVCAPDVEETSYYVYEDEIEARKRREREKPVTKQKKIHGKFNGARTNDAWSLAWPCNKKRDITYRESNCFMVPSKYEALHPSAKLENAQPIEKPEPIGIEENQEFEF